jgi:aminoglycoside 3-N-acetyltransferase
VSTLVYALARRMLSQERRSRINTRLAGLRKQFAPALRRLHGSFDAAALRQELTRVLPSRFDALMVHCAFDDLQPMFTESAGRLLNMLQGLCGPERTLLMPAFTFNVPGGDLVAHFQKNQRFDVRRQPSQMGLLSEVFRRTPGVKRSLHPTHSVCALGPLAEELTRGHEQAPTTFGADTPFARMAEIDTVIVGLGKPFYRVLTQTHVPEDLMGDRFPVPRTFRGVDIVLADAVGEHPYHFRVDVTAIERRVHRLRAMLEPGELTEWTFHGVPLFWTRAGIITSRMSAAALRGRTIYSGPTLA